MKGVCPEGTTVGNHWNHPKLGLILLTESPKRDRKVEHYWVGLAQGVAFYVILIVAASGLFPNMPQKLGEPTAIMIGKVGAGKTTIFNKVCDANRAADITDDSCTRQFVSRRVYYDYLSMVLYDGPGCNSKEDTYAHSFVLRHGLTREPLSGIFFTLEYNPRIRNNMGGDFYEVSKILKEEAYDHIIVLVTKMDQFQPDPSFPTRQSMENHIRRTFEADYGMQQVVFSD